MEFAVTYIGVPRSLTRAQQAEIEFDDFFDTTLDRTIALLTLITRDVHAAEDAAQEAYARAYQRWGHVRAMDRPDLWVVRVGTNIAINIWKKHRREKNFDVDTAGGQPEMDGLIAHEQWVNWGLDTLSLAQRRAFVMHHAQGWSIPDVAIDMKATESTVRTHLQRAREKLRALLSMDKTS
jgi:RNA polymerase sigma-70 factor (ECF subfamily)